MITENSIRVFLEKEKVEVSVRLAIRERELQVLKDGQFPKKDLEYVLGDEELLKKFQKTLTMSPVTLELLRTRRFRFRAKV